MSSNAKPSAPQGAAPARPDFYPTHLRKGSDGQRSWRYWWGTMILENCQHKSRPVRRGDALVVGATSDRTQHLVNDLVMKLAGVLRVELGFKLDKPHKLQVRHVAAWAEWLNDKRASGEYLPATCAGYATAVRHICRWSGNNGLVARFDELLDQSTTARRLLAERDKSWEANQVDINEALLKVWAEEPWVAMCLLAQAGFGLRRREAVQLHPLRDINLEDGYLQIRDGAKGGRPRLVPIDTHDRREVAITLIDYSRWSNVRAARAPHTRTPMPPEHMALHQALYRYSNVVRRSAGLTMAEEGVTGHGLRAGYVCQRLQELGITAVVRGGTGILEGDPSATARALRQVSESVGHCRPQIVGAYAGSPHVAERVLASEHLRSRGLLLPGNTPQIVAANAQRITDWLASLKSTQRAATQPIHAGPTQPQEGASHVR